MRVVFGLHNFAYHDAELFRHVDAVVVPSAFARAWYRERLGIECHVLPYVIETGRVESGGRRAGSQKDGTKNEPPHSRHAGTQKPGPFAKRERELRTDSQPSTLNPQGFVTFVNPQPAKGVFVFARIAEELARRRPDIPILVVESRGGTRWLEQTGVDLSWATNLFAMSNTHDPRDFYAVTRLLLVPSLWKESFGLVAAEAMTNGIPVLASNRGALPELLGSRERRATSREPETHRGQRSGVRSQSEQTRSGGFLFDIPAHYTPETMVVPTREDVEPWVETVIRLWDDPSLYEQRSQSARRYAERWRPDRLSRRYADFFRRVAST